MARKLRFGYWSLLGSICLLLPQWVRAGNAPVSLESLLEEMVSRDSLARWPIPAYRAIETTSHDRSKTNPADAATWHSNKDYENFIRVEENAGRKEWVITENDGPGAITRIWLPLEPTRDKQIIRFYLDGATVPAIEANFNDLLSGRVFVKAPLAYVAWDETDLRHQIDNLPKTMRGVGGDLYLPIPYAKSCKITLDQIPFYYHIQYRAYEPGTEVKSFSMAGFEAAKPTIEKITQSLTAPQAASVAPDKEQIVAPGEEFAIDLPNGAAAVREIRVHIDPKDAARSRSVVLSAAFDGEPDIWCPISEFFGAGPRCARSRIGFEPQPKSERSQPDGSCPMSVQRVWP